MAHPGEVQRGDIVRWFDALARREREGEVVRCARNGLWIDVRYPIEPKLFPEVTHLTRRVRITQARLVRKAQP